MIPCTTNSILLYLMSTLALNFYLFYVGPCPWAYTPMWVPAPSGQTGKKKKEMVELTYSILDWGQHGEARTMSALTNF